MLSFKHYALSSYGDDQVLGVFSVVKLIIIVGSTTARLALRC